MNKHLRAEMGIARLEGRVLWVRRCRREQTIAFRDAWCSRGRSPDGRSLRGKSVAAN